MKLYHGSNVSVPVPLAKIGRTKVDFGQGFYLTVLRLQAISWARIAANYGIAARIASECGFCGLLIDNEDYHGLKQFNYVPETDGEYDKAAAMMRRRGREVFSAIFREFPKIRLGLFWAFSNIRTQLKADDPAAEIRASGRLFPQFLNGLLDVMPPGAVVIDFNEDADRKEYESCRLQNANFCVNWDCAVQVWRAQRLRTTMLPPTDAFRLALSAIRTMSGSDSGYSPFRIRSRTVRAAI